MRRMLYGLFALLVLAAGAATAQPAPPSRVGRVSLVEGTLALQLPGERAWTAADRNYPVANGTELWTAPGARAQMQLGPDTLALAPQSTLDITRLEAATTRLGLWGGRLFLHIRAIESGESVAVDLPQGEVRLLAPGEYDIAAGGPDAPARIAVFAGRASFLGQGAEIGIAAGKTAVLRGDSAQFAAAQADGFVAWFRAHDYRENRLAAAYYVSPEMTGYAALDEYGRWAPNPEYGEVWFPNEVPADWAPYRFGEWVSIAPWGWTWIDAAPWGFAPFHYGRWARFGGRWGWVPGRFERRPVYAPALVVFIGGEGIGWFPLAPGEAYWPSYTADVGYIGRLNAGQIKDAGRLRLAPRERAAAHFANRRFATVVSRPAFGHGQRVEKARLKVEPEKLERAPLQARPPKIAAVVAHPLARPPAPAKRRASPPPGVAAIPPPHPLEAPPHAVKPAKPPPAAVTKAEPLRPVEHPAAHPPAPPPSVTVLRPAPRAPTPEEQKAREEALRLQQQRAAQQRALEQQRAAQLRAIEQQRAAQQRALEQQRAAQQHPPPHPPEKAPPCGHPGEPPCPH